MTARQHQAPSEGDFLWLCGCIMLLCAATLLLAREYRQTEQNVRYLMDNAVTRETEPRPS